MLLYRPADDRGMPFGTIVRSHLKTNLEHNSCQHVAPRTEGLLSLLTNVLTDPLDLGSPKAYYPKD